MRPIEWTMLLILSVIWGASFFFIKVALSGFDPFTVVFIRVALAAIVLVCVVYVRGLRLPASPRVWGALFVLGAINNALPFSLIAWGETRIDSGTAAVFNATTPIFVGILAHFFTADEKLTPGKVVGMLVGFFGVYLMMSPEFRGGVSWRGLGQVAVLGAAASYAASGVFAKRFKDQPPIVTAAGMLIGASILIMPLAILNDAPWSCPPLEAVGSLVTLAVVGTAAAYVIFFRILSTAGATNVLLVTFLVPIGALVLGVTILKEIVRWEELVGMGLIFLGLAFIDGRIFARMRKGVGGQGRHS
jgi:drug/metabolite transporter (DMT)-like permease